MQSHRNESVLARRAAEVATAFGLLIRSRRKAMRMRQDELALASGVGRRFLIELEAGKPSCQLGRSLLVAQALGLQLTDILHAACGEQAVAAPELPDMPDDLETAQ